jgi:hypothetical protein
LCHVLSVCHALYLLVGASLGPGQTHCPYAAYM